MRTISKSYKQEETLPLPVWHDDDRILQYDSEWADGLVCRAYGDETRKYEVHPSTLELYYNVSNKMRFKIADITYESYFTDIKGREWEEEWLETFQSVGGEDFPPEQYEMYNMTLYHYNHPSLKSNLLNSSNKLKGIKSEKYIKDLMRRIEREDLEEE